MLRLRKIAVTGGLASGKTTACQFFKELGAYVVDADAIVHALLDPNTELGRKVIALLGPQIVQDGAISRPAVAKSVFSSPEKLKALEILLHPAVSERVEALYKQASSEGKYTGFVVEIPLLFESGQESFYDAVIAITTDVSLAKKRFAKRGFAESEYEKRMERQMSPSEKAERAHHTLANNGSPEDLQRQIASLYKTLQHPPSGV